MRIARAGLLAALLAGASVPAAAQEPFDLGPFRFFALEGIVSLEGPLGPGDAALFLGAVDQVRQPPVFLITDGRNGSMVEALAVAEEIHRRDLITGLGGDDIMCNAPCVIMMLAGRVSMVDTSFIVIWPGPDWPAAEIDAALDRYDAPAEIREAFHQGPLDASTFFPDEANALLME